MLSYYQFQKLKLVETEPKFVKLFNATHLIRVKMFTSTFLKRKKEKKSVSG